MTLTAQELVDLATRLQQDRADMSDLLARVLDSVLDRAPDGMTVAYLSADLVAEIERHLGA